MADLHFISRALVKQTGQVSIRKLSALGRVGCHCDSRGATISEKLQKFDFSCRSWQQFKNIFGEEQSQFLQPIALV